MKPLATLGIALLSAAPWAQEQRAYLDAPVVGIDEYVPPFKRLFDGDADGELELLGWYSAQAGAYHAHSVYVYRELPLTNGGWERYTYAFFTNVYDYDSVAGDSYPMLVEVGPIGAPDDKDEFVMLYGQHVEIWEAGYPNEGALVEFLLPARSIDGAVGDFDGDGRGDVVALMPASATFFLHRSGTDGYEEVTLPLPARGWEYVEVGEFDGLPGDEVAFVSGGEVRVHSQRHPQPPFRQRAKLRQAGFPTYLHGLPDPDPAVGDVDGDGDDDLALFSMNGQYRVLRQEAPGRLVLGPAESGGPATDLADVDQDGDLDGVCCSGGGGGPNFPFIPRTDFYSEFMISPNRGDGTFEEAWSMPSLGADFIAGAEDLDDDGDVDLVAGRVVYWNPGRLLRPIEPVPGVSDPLQSEIHDLDGDGDPDFAVTIYGYRRNQGDGTTVASTPLLPPPPVGATWTGPGYVGDFTEDGLVDFIVECWEGGTFEGVHLLVNMGGEVFADAGAVCVPGEPFSAWTGLEQENCVIADFDSNGTMDLALRRRRNTLPEYRTMRTDIWLNDGVSAFTPVPTWDELRILAVGEFSGDGLNDVIVFDHRGNNAGFRVRYGLPAGGFGEPTLIGLYGAFFSVSPVQLWNDSFAVTDLSTAGSSVGIDEFIAYQRGQRYAKLARGEPGGFWQYTSDLRMWLQDEVWYTEDVQYGVQLADLDGDGTPGYLVNTPKYAVQSTWVAREDYGVFGAQNPASIQMLTVSATADVDGDGDVDGLGDRIVHARAFEGASAGARLQSGVGVAGANGVVPTLGATGPFRVGEEVVVRVLGGVAGQTGELHVSRGAGPTPDFPVAGVTAWLDPADDVYIVAPLLFEAPTSGVGAAVATVILTIPPSYAGQTEYLQAFLDDAAAPNGISASNGLQLAFGE